MLLTNPHLPNLLKGQIYRGKGKTVCVPGLNCYSCPAATGACPIGAVQSVIGSSKFKFSYYVTGTLILLGVLLGRFVCGFLCPFGWFQELIHKIPLPKKKLSTKKLRPLRYLKYLILLLTVTLPLIFTNEVGMGNPFFCKYLCPQGVLEGAIPLSLASESVRSALGSLFTWKSVVLGAVVVLSLLFYRPFCKWLCPLGAFYALFNRVSLTGMQVDAHKCVHCGRCEKACKMDVDVTKTPDHPECIRCGMCVKGVSHGRGQLPLRAEPRGKGKRESSRQTSRGEIITEKKRRTFSMKKTWIALLLALCMLTTIGAASACCTSACCTKPSGTDEAQTMEETCTCIIDGKAMDDCACMTGMCDEKCSCGEKCDCAEKKLEMLTAEMNAVFEKNMDLWNRFFGMMDKQPDMNMSYADYLTAQLELKKEKFTEDEYKLLQQDIETIRRLDEEMERLMPKDDVTAGSDVALESGVVTAGGGIVMGGEGMMMTDGSMDDKDMRVEDDSSEKFPAFQGMDLDGNPVSNELFKENSVTVINFWFSACAPCIGELGELNALNEELKLKGGAVIGINADTIGGDESMIMEAKNILEKKGAMYQNIYFPADSEAGKLTYSITAFPTTVVVDRNGNMVGEPILGGINSEKQMKALQTMIDEVLARDAAMLDKDMLMKPDGK